MLPLPCVAALGQLMRDLMSLDPDACLLRRWSPLDHLFLVALISERAPRLRRYSEPLVTQIDRWIQSRPVDETSMLFGEWVMGTASTSKADELMGSLGANSRRSPTICSGAARKQAYLAMPGAIFLDERSHGTSIEEIEQRWGIADFDGPDEDWRDTALWMLAGHAGIFEIRSFYHHLQKHCSADPGQIRGAKRALGRLRGQAYDLIEQLNPLVPSAPDRCKICCSPPTLNACF
jgi:hypothetical protein